MSTYLDTFFDAYVECALWSSTIFSDDGNDGDPMDDHYGPEDIAPETLAAMREDCHAFVVRASMEVRRDWSAEQAGHDFWLTRNGHGAGFWDRGHAQGDLLTKYAKEWGGVDLYVGDDGLVHA